MTFCLDTTIIKPENNVEIKNAIILLHGYGGDGKDISVLSLNWRRHLPNTVFICPNGHERCQINLSGYQWFDLSNDDPKYILEQSKKAEKKLFEYIDQIKEKYFLSNSQIIISGFSQGCMMAINLGLISLEKFKCIIGFSGRIIDIKDLEQRIISRPKILLFHGDADQVVSPSSLLEAKDFFIRNNIEAQTKMLKNCQHHIPTEALSIALKYILNLI